VDLLGLVQVVAVHFPEKLKKAAACKPGNFHPFFDLIEGLELCATRGMQVL